MRIKALAPLFLLTAALPAFAQTSPATVAALPTLTAGEQAQADAALIEALDILLAGKRAPANPLLRAMLDRAGPPADIAALKAGDTLPVFTRWLDARRVLLGQRRWREAARWIQLVAAYRLGNAALDEAADATPVTGETFDEIYFLVHALIMAGETDRAAAFIRPFLAAPDPRFEIAFATDLAGRVQSVDNWGGAEKPRAAGYVALALAQFDRPGARAPEQVRLLHYALGNIRRTAGDIAGARAAYARSRAPGAPLGDEEIALMFEAGESDAGVRAVQQSLGEAPSPTLSRAATDKLVAIGGQTGSGNAGTIAIYRIALQSYRRLLKPTDKALENTAAVLAASLMSAGDAAQAEPLLAELFASYERRFGFDSGGANRYARQLADAIAAQARYDEADLLYRRLWALVEQYKAYHDLDAQRYAEAIVGIQLVRGQIAAAEAFNGDALRRARASKELDGGTLAAYLIVQARILALAGKPAEAQAAAREAIAAGPPDDQLTVAAAFDSPEARARAQLAALLEADGKAAEAEPLRRLLLARIEANDMIPWEGDLRRDAVLALAANLTLQGKSEGRALFGERLALNRRIFGADSPQLLDVAEPFARALLRAGRAGDALTPARAALAARTAGRYLGDAAALTRSDRALATRRREAARLMVEAAWRAGEAG